MRPAPILATLFLAAALGAEAAPPEGGPMQHRLKVADTNGDGMISRAEAAALPRLAKHFDEIDANKDGFITIEELRAHHESRRGEHIRKMDANGDGRIDRTEAAAFPRLAEHFDEIDTNKDGFLSPQELRAARLARRK